MAAYSYYNPSLPVSHAKKDPMFALNLAQSAMSADSRVKDAIVVEATKDATQFGKECHNVLDLLHNPI